MVDETPPPAPTPPPSPETPAPADALLDSAHTDAVARARSRLLRPRNLVIAGAAAVVIAVVAIIVATSGGSSRLQDAVDRCGLAETSGIRLLDDGRTLAIDTQGEDDASGAGLFEAICATSALDMPDRIWSLITSTRALDGRQTDSWDGLTATWSYHPDSGLALMITED